MGKCSGGPASEDSFYAFLSSFFQNELLGVWLLLTSHGAAGVHFRRVLRGPLLHDFPVDTVLS